MWFVIDFCKTWGLFIWCMPEPIMYIYICIYIYGIRILHTIVLSFIRILLISYFLAAHFCKVISCIAYTWFPLIRRAFVILCPDQDFLHLPRKQQNIQGCRGTTRSKIHPDSCIDSLAAWIQWTTGKPGGFKNQVLSNSDIPKRSRKKKKAVLRRRSSMSCKQ